MLALEFDEGGMDLVGVVGADKALVIKIQRHIAQACAQGYHHRTIDQHANNR